MIRYIRCFLGTTVLVLLLIGMSNLGWAQDATSVPVSVPASDTTTASAAPSDMSAKPAPKKTFVDTLRNAGPAVWICILLSICVTAFTIEGFIKLRFTALTPPKQFSTLQQLLGQGSYQEAWQYCRQHRSFLCIVTGAGLKRLGRGGEVVEQTLEEVSAQQTVLLKTNANYLSAIGVIAPMIGLTGTVIGMIRAFQSLGASGIGDPSALASAIGEVLLATASGLIVAIPGFAFFYVFKSKAQTAVMLTNSAIYSLFDEIPFDQLTGIAIGDGFVVQDRASVAYSEPSDEVA